MAAIYDTTTLKNAIETAMETASAITIPEGSTPEEIAELAAEKRAEQAQSIADAVEVFVKKVIDTAIANVTVTAPIGLISVVGTATAQANAAPIPISGTGTLS